MAWLPEVADEADAVRRRTFSVGKARRQFVWRAWASLRGLRSALEEEPQDLEDLELSAVEETEEIGVGQPEARLPDELPPGFITPESSDPCHLYIDPKSGHDPWVYQIRKETAGRRHKRLPPAPLTMTHTVDEDVPSLPDLIAQVRPVAQQDGVPIVPAAQVRSAVDLKGRGYLRHTNAGRCGATGAGRATSEQAELDHAVGSPVRNHLHPCVVQRGVPLVGAGAEDEGNRRMIESSRSLQHSGFQKRSDCSRSILRVRGGATVMMAGSPRAAMRATRLTRVRRDAVDE